MSQSKIEWTESTWNPVTGCTKISEGCINCYAERMAKRLYAMGQPNYSNGFKVTCHPQALYTPLHWKKPRLVFVNSMSDLFHENIPEKFISDIFNVMKKASWHHFQVLTKRSQRMVEFSNRFDWPSNVWVGVTIEAKSCKYRIDDLGKIPAKIRFLSMEPLLESIGKLDLTNVDWVIVGGESGPNARIMKKEWVLEVRNQCQQAGVDFFFKQWGGVNKKKAGRLLDGRTWDDMPQAIFA